MNIKITVLNIFENKTTYPKIKAQVEGTNEIIVANVKKEHITPTLSRFGMLLVKSKVEKSTLEIALASKENKGYTNVWVNPTVDELNYEELLKQAKNK